MIASKLDGKKQNKNGSHKHNTKKEKNLKSNTFIIHNSFSLFSSNRRSKPKSKPNITLSSLFLHYSDQFNPFYSINSTKFITHSLNFSPHNNIYILVSPFVLINHFSFMVFLTFLYQKLSTYLVVSIFYISYD